MKDHGGQVVYGNGNAFNDRRLTPTIILNPDPKSPLMSQEIFGPLLPIKTYKNLDEVIQYINEGEKPLALYYFGKKNGANQERVDQECSSGAFVTNETLMHIANPDLPFGGVGHSGIGKMQGETGFRTFSNMKSHLIKGVLNYKPFT